MADTTMAESELWLLSTHQPANTTMNGALQDSTLRHSNKRYYDSHYAWCVDVEHPQEIIFHFSLFFMIPKNCSTFKVLFPSENSAFPR
jgi:hypothetical protein